MEYTLMQMPSSLWHMRQFIFDKDSKVFLKDYVPVYKGEVSVEVPEDDKYFVDHHLDKLFHIFNTAWPANFCARSMSSGDVVYINEDYYLCCSFGWHKLDRGAFTKQFTRT